MVQGYRIPKPLRSRCSAIPRMWLTGSTCQPAGRRKRKNWKACCKGTTGYHTGHLSVHPIGQNVITWPHLSCRGRLGSVVFVLGSHVPHPFGSSSIKRWENGYWKTTRSCRGCAILASPRNTLHSRGSSSSFRILEKDKRNIDAYQILAVHELAREGNMTTVSSFKTQKLSLETSMAVEEPLMAPPTPRLWRMLPGSRLPPPCQAVCCGPGALRCGHGDSWLQALPGWVWKGSFSSHTPGAVPALRWTLLPKAPL